MSDPVILTREQADALRAELAAERGKATRLWMLLDDIDTADDAAKSDDRLFRDLARAYQKKRWWVIPENEIDARIDALLNGGGDE